MCYPEVRQLKLFFIAFLYKFCKGEFQIQSPVISILKVHEQHFYCSLWNFYICIQITFAHTKLVWNHGYTCFGIETTCGFANASVLDFHLCQRKNKLFWYLGRMSISLYRGLAWATWGHLIPETREKYQLDRSASSEELQGTDKNSIEVLALSNVWIKDIRSSVLWTNVRASRCILFLPEQCSLNTCCFHMDM